jgi:hypothetical protein
MVRSRWIKAVLATVASTGLALGQAPAPSSPKTPDDPTGRIITVNEAGKAAQKCRVVKWWVDEKGSKVWQVEALDTHEVMTIVAVSAPVMGAAPAEHSRSLRTKIFHWAHNAPPPGAPLCPTCETDCAPCTTTGPTVVTTTPCTPCPPCTTAPLPVIETVPAPKPTKIVTCQPKPCETKIITEAPKVTKPEPSLVQKWRESWGKPEAPKVVEKKEPPQAPLAKVETPHAEPTKCDPLLSDPTKYAKAPLDEKLPPKPELPPIDPIYPNRPAPLPGGARSVIDSGAMTYAPVPVVTLPPLNITPPARPPSPQWQVPQGPPNPIIRPGGGALEANQGGIPSNAFLRPELTPPKPGSAGVAAMSNAFSADTDPHPGPAMLPASGVFGPPPAPPGPPTMAQFGARPTPPGMLPPTPYGPVVRLPLPQDQAGPQLAKLPPPQGTGITQTAYQAPRPSAETAQQLTATLRDALYPSQREMAAEKLATLEWRQNEVAVEALTRAVREDPAATVRVTCIHALAKMKVNTLPAVKAIEAARTDVDVRVRNEAEDALSILAPK